MRGCEERERERERERETDGEANLANPNPCHFSLQSGVNAECIRWPWYKVGDIVEALWDKQNRVSRT